MAKAKPEPEPTLAEQAQSLPNPPELPPIRTFEVTRSDKFISEVLEAHSVEIAGNGTLMFFEYSNEMDDKTGRWKLTGRMRRAFAEGKWDDIKEVMLPARYEATN